MEINFSWNSHTEVGVGVSDPAQTPCYFVLPSVSDSAWFRSRTQSRFCVLFFSCLLPRLKHADLQSWKQGSYGGSSQMSHHDSNWSLQPGRNSIAKLQQNLHQKILGRPLLLRESQSCVLRTVSVWYPFWVRHKGEEVFPFVRIIYAVGHTIHRRYWNCCIVAQWKSCKMCWACSSVTLWADGI